MKTVEIRQRIRTLITGVHPRVFYERAPKGAAFPYVVFNMPTTLNPDLALEVYNLEVDIWDQSSDSTLIESLASNIDSELHRHTSVEDDLSMTIYRENRLNIIDNEPEIRRRQYVYQVRTYEGGIV